MLLSNKKGWTTNAHDTVGKSPMHCNKWEETDVKEYVLCDTSYLKL